MNILLTGSGGFIGKNLKSYLQDKYTLFCPRSFELDLTDKKAVQQYFTQNKVDFIIHCGSTGGARGIQDKDTTIQDNLAMVNNLIDAKREDVRIILFGSGAMYGRDRDLHKISEDKIGNLLNSIAILDSRKKVLTEMQKDLEGFNNSVKNLIKHSETNQNLKKQFIGVVANLMEVPKIYETAVEMALGGAIQNIVTENEQNANSLIDYLKQNSLGRATFLPLTTSPL